VEGENTEDIEHAPGAVPADADSRGQQRGVEFDVLRRGDEKLGASEDDGLAVEGEVEDDARVPRGGRGERVAQRAGAGVVWDRDDAQGPRSTAPMSSLR